MGNFKQLNADYWNQFHLQDETDSLWTFGLVCLELAEELNKSSFEINEANCYLSVNDDQLVWSLCELIVCFCIHYNLEDNVGMPIERLSKYGFMLREARIHTTVEQKNQRLHVTLSKIDGLRKCVREHVNLVDKFCAKYLHDLICALVQLCHSPNSMDIANKADYLKWLEVDLYGAVDSSALIRSLIMVQGANSTKSPKWFLIKTGDLLTGCMLKPNSLMNLIKAVMENVDGKSLSSTHCLS